MSRLRTWLCGPTMAVIDELEQSWRRTWSESLSDAGAAALNLQNDDADLAGVTFGRIVRFDLDNVAVFPMLVESKTRHAVDQGEEADQYTEVKGRGTLALWEDMVVYPELGAGQVLISDTRLFNFASKYYDDSGWGFAVQSEQGTGDAGGSRFGAPANLPPEAEVAWWIWSEASPTTGSVAAGDAYFRKSYFSTGELVRIFVTADNAHELYLDGELVEIDDVAGGGGIGWAGLKELDRYLGPGTHVFAIKGTNVASVAPNPAGVFMAVIQLVDAGATLGAVKLVTDSSWKALGYPASVPGFTPGKVIRLLLEEAQGRAGMAGMTLGFTDTTDTAGAAWPVTADIAFPIGLDGLSVLRQLAESYIDCAMAPSALRLDAWRHATRGSAKAVTLAPGTNVTEMTHEMGG